MSNSTDGERANRAKHVHEDEDPLYNNSRNHSEGAVRSRSVWAVGFIAVMHDRGRVETPSGGHVRGSVWVEQEIAIAAFLAQAQGRSLPVLVYIQKGIAREGVRQQLRLKPVEFEGQDEILTDLRDQIIKRTFEPLPATFDGLSWRRV